MPPQIPVIDIAALATDSAPADAERDVATQIDEACRQYGFFYIKNHGLDDSIREGAFNAAQSFFMLPSEEKLKSKDVDFSNSGYHPPAMQHLDEGRLEETHGKGADNGDNNQGKKKGDVQESFLVTLRSREGASEAECALTTRWPQMAAADFEQPIDTYFRAAAKLSQAIVRGLALAIGELVPGAGAAAWASAGSPLARLADDPRLTLRLLRYPPLASGLYEAGSFGIGAHTDWGVLTLLAQDGCGGLEVCLPPDPSQPEAPVTWIPAQPVEGALLVNVGDLTHRLTNGRYHSAPHRVRNPGGEGQAVDPDRPRYSVVLFNDGTGEAIVDPRDLDPSVTPKWPPVSAKQYLVDRIAATFAGADAAREEL